MVVAHLAPALVQLRAEINALWPGRDRSSDGWIGDVAHSSRASDHNPDALGRVHAIDIDEDLTAGGSSVGKASDLVAQIMRDPRTAYVIYEGRIWENPAAYPGRGYWRTYTGTNSHSHHVHVSVRRGSWGGDGRSWGLVRSTSTGVRIPTAPTVGHIPASPAPLEPEDDEMNDEQWASINGSLGLIAEYAKDAAERSQATRELATRIALGTVGTTDAEYQIKTPGELMKGVIALHGALAALLQTGPVTVDPKALADGIAEALGDDLAGRFLDALTERLGRA